MATFVRRIRQQPFRQRRFVFSKGKTISPVVGSSTGSSTVSGVLRAKGYVDGNTSGVSTASGSLKAKGYFDGSSAGIANVSGLLGAIGYAEGASDGLGDAVASMQANGYLEGSSSGLAASVAALRGTGYLNGTSDGSSNAAATAVLPDGFAAGSSAGTSTVSGTLIGVARIDGSIAGTSSASGILSASAYISAIDGGIAVANGTLSGIGYLSGSSSGSSTTSATPMEVVEIGSGVPMLSAGIWRKSQPNTICFVLVDENDDEVTGLGSAFSLKIRRVGGSFQNGAGTKSEIGLGWYQYVSTPAEASISGPVAIVITGSGIDQQNLEYVVEDRVVTAINFTYTLTLSDNTTPIPGADITFSISSDPADTVWSGVTDAFGVARDLNGNLPRLSPGSYYVFTYKPGYIFENPDLEAVS